MANVRLLRQSVENYQKKIKAGNEDYEGEYAAYAASIPGYNAQLQARANYDAALAATAAGTPTWMKNANGTGSLMRGVDKNGNPIPYDPAHFSNQQVDWSGAQMYLTPSPPAVGTAPVNPSPVPPTEPNITASNMREWMNPGLNQAQGQLQQAKGIVAKSDLAGEQGEALKNSAFAKQDDPQGLKERGVLARVMGGQL